MQHRCLKVVYTLAMHVRLHGMYGADPNRVSQEDHQRILPSNGDRCFPISHLHHSSAHNFPKDLHFLPSSMPAIEVPISQASKATESWFAPEARALETFIDLFGPILIAALPSILMWTFKSSRFASTGFRSPWLIAGASTLVCWLLLMELSERNAGFLDWDWHLMDAFRFCFLAISAMLQVLSAAMYLDWSLTQSKKEGYSAIPHSSV